MRREGNRRKRNRRPERAAEGMAPPSSHGLHARHGAAPRPSTGMTTRRHTRPRVREDTPDEEEDDDDEEAQPALSCAPALLCHILWFHVCCVL